MAEAEVIAAYHAGRLERASEVLAEARAQVATGGAPNPKVDLTLAEWQLYVAVTLRAPDIDRRIAETRALAAAAFGEEHPRSAYSRLFPRVYRPEEAAEEAADLELLTEVGPEMWGDALSHRVDARILGGAPADALALLEEARAREIWASLPPATGRVLAGLEAEALVALERYEDAAAVLDGVAPGEGEEPLPRVQLVRARLAEHRGDLPGALSLLRPLVADYEASFDPDHPELAEVRFALAQVLRASGDPSGAQTRAKEALRAYRALGAAFAPEVAAIEAWRGQGA
jgi:tetratricopeptide (TPR) repeat protein